MLSKLSSWLQVRQREGAMVVLVALLFALIEAGRGLGGNSADALFFRRFGVEFLPYMFMLLGVTTFIITVSYTAALQRINKNIFYVGSLVVFIAVILIERAAVLSDFGLLYPVLWITINSIGTVLGLQAWHVTGEVTDTRQAKRLYSIFISGGILGSLVGNFLTGTLAQRFGTDNLLILYAALLALSVGVTLLISRRFFTPSPAPTKSVKVIDDLREGFQYVRHSNMLLLVAYASVLFSILYFSVSFPFSKQVAASYPKEADLAGFLGTFSGIVTAITFAVSLFIANRLYARIGVVNAVLILPIIYLGGFIFWVFNFSLTSAIVVRFAQMVLLGGVASPAWNALFNVAPPERRAHVLGFDAAVPSQIGVVLSGVLLLLGERVLTTNQIFIMGMALALACGLLLWRMRGAYASALVNALREGYMQVFEAGGGSLRNVRLDAQALKTAVSGLTDPKPGVRRIAAEMLGKLGAKQAIPALQEALRDAEAEVRSGAVNALAQLEGEEAVADLVPLLNDPEPTVRVEAVRALAALKLTANPEVHTALHPRLDDSDARVRVQTVLALSKAKNGLHARTEQVLSALLAAPDVDEQILALNAFGELGENALLIPILPKVTHPNPSVRAAAIRALKHTQVVDPASGLRHGVEDVSSALLQALDDPDAHVREAAAQAVGASEKNTAPLTDVLKSGTERAQEAALSVLIHHATARLAVRDFATIQIARATQWRRYAQAMELCCDASSAAAYLRDLMREREEATEGKILTALEAFSTPETTQLIKNGLNSSSQYLRSQALEALDTVGDKQIISAFLPLLEDVATDVPIDPLPTLRELSTSTDVWLRALAVRALGEVVVGRVRDVMERAQHDPEPLVRSAVSDVLGLLGGTSVETLQTLSTLERILFLRQVSIFARLEPEDLKQIADRATERVFQPGDDLVREGEVGDELFILIEGQAKITKRMDNSQSIRPVRTAKAGEPVGELAILLEQKRSATVTADGGPVRALVISRDAFKAIMRDRPQVALGLIRSLAEKLSQS